MAMGEGDRSGDQTRGTPPPSPWGRGRGGGRVAEASHLPERTSAIRFSPRVAGFAGTGTLGVLALLLDVADVAPTVIVLLSAVAIGGLAWIVGLATEQLGAATGPKISGVLNVAFGNAAEIVITIFALRQGLSTLVKASITGSILSNMLLVLGL